MRRSSPLTRTTPIRRAPMTRRPNKKRNAVSFARAYGSTERVAFVNRLPCVACGRVGYCVNAHVVKGDRGMAFKASARFIAPLCGHLWSIVSNCHGELHWIGPDSFQAKYGIDLAACAARTEAAWQAHQGAA